MVDWGMIGNLVGGTVTTLWISAVSIAVGAPLGLMLALTRVWRVPVLSQAVAVFVSIVPRNPAHHAGSLCLFRHSRNRTDALPDRCRADCAFGQHVRISRRDLACLAHGFPQESIGGGQRVWHDSAAGISLDRAAASLAGKPAADGQRDDISHQVEPCHRSYRRGRLDAYGEPDRRLHLRSPTPYISAAIIYAVVVFSLVRAQRVIERIIVRRYGVL